MAQKRAVSLGNTTFNRKLYVSELDEPNNIQSEVNITEAGIHVVWQNEILTPYITLVSREHGWLDQATKDSILADYGVLGTSFVLTYDDGSTDDVRFAHEKGISFTAVIEGCEPYTTQINLAKVIV